MSDDLTYADFFSADDVDTYRRVKRGSMNLARVAREVVAEMVGGRIVQEDDSRKEYMTTRRGRFRLAMSHNSDNETERREHARLHAEIVVMGDSDAMGEFFARHGLDGRFSVLAMRAAIRSRL